MHETLKRVWEKGDIYLSDYEGWWVLAPLGASTACPPACCHPSSLAQGTPTQAAVCELRGVHLALPSSPHAQPPGNSCGWHLDAPPQNQTRPKLRVLHAQRGADPLQYSPGNPCPYPYPKPTGTAWTARSSRTPRRWTSTTTAPHTAKCASTGKRWAFEPVTAVGLHQCSVHLTSVMAVRPMRGTTSR